MAAGIPEQPDVLEPASAARSGAAWVERINEAINFVFPLQHGDKEQQRKNLLPHMIAEVLLNERWAKNRAFAGDQMFADVREFSRSIAYDTFEMFSARLGECQNKEHDASDCPTRSRLQLIELCGCHPPQ